MKDKRVYVKFGMGPKQNARDALQHIEPDVYRGKSVLIKPNVGRQVASARGINTHPDAVAGVIETLKDGGARSTSIGESPIIGVNAIAAFKESGIADVADAYGCDLVDLDSGTATRKEIPDGMILYHT
jgi:uncharacterized protein (DUF362 family)